MARVGRWTRCRTCRRSITSHNSQPFRNGRDTGPSDGRQELQPVPDESARQSKVRRSLTPSHITHQPISPRLACHSRHRVLAHHSQPPYRPFTGLVEQPRHGRQLAPPACRGMLLGRWCGRCARLGSLRTVVCGQRCRLWRFRTTFPLHAPFASFRARLQIVSAWGGGMASV